MWNGQNGVFQAHASLSIHGAGLVPEEITALLGVEATRTSTADARGAWSFSTRDRIAEIAPLEDHLRHLLDTFEPTAEALRNIQARFSTRAFCYFASQSDLGGFKIGSATLRRLGDLGLDLDVDEYFCAEE